VRRRLATGTSNEVQNTDLILFTDPPQGISDPMSADLSEFCTEARHLIAALHLWRLLDGEVVAGPADM